MCALFWHSNLSTKKNIAIAFSPMLYNSCFVITIIVYFSKYCFLPRVLSNLNLRVIFILRSTTNRFCMMGNLQAVLPSLTMLKLLMLSYALNLHQRKILQFLYTLHTLLCFRFVYRLFSCFINVSWSFKDCQVLIESLNQSFLDAFNLCTLVGFSLFVNLPHVIILQYYKLFFFKLYLFIFANILTLNKPKI